MHNAGHERRGGTDEDDLCTNILVNMNGIFQGVFEMKQFVLLLCFGDGPSFAGHMMKGQR